MFLIIHLFIVEKLAYLNWCFLKKTKKTRGLLCSVMLCKNSTFDSNRLSQPKSGLRRNDIDRISATDRIINL